MNLVFSTVGVPRGRGKIERFFLTINQLFLQDLPGYIGNNSMRNHLTLQELDDKLNEFIISVYHNRPHGTTKIAPILRWSQSGFLPNMPDSLEDLDLLLLNVAKSRKVHTDGIYFQGLRYINTNLAAYVGETVIIRYDPRDIAEVRVFYQDKYLCTAIAPEISDYTVDLKDIVSARNKRRKDLKKDLYNNQTIADSIVLTKQTEMKTNIEKVNLKSQNLRGISMNKTKKFIETKEYKRFAEFCDACIKYKYIGICYGLPGVGKTLSSRYYSNWDYVEKQIAYKRADDIGINADSRILDIRTLFYTAPAVKATKMISDIDLMKPFLVLSE